MRTAIVTDSNSGIFEQEAKQMGIRVIPMPVILDEKTYYEGRDLSHRKFFQLLEEGRHVSSSQPSLEDIKETWEKLFEEGYEEIVHIPMSSGLSGSFQSARMLARKYDGRVQVADNHRISVTLRQSVEEALELAQQGKDAAEIKEVLEKKALDAIIFVGVETLEYLKRGGRITPAAAAMGELLHIKPLLLIQGERLDAFAKVRGTKSCKKRMLREIREKVDACHAAGRKVLVGAAGSFADEAQEQEWKSMVQEAFPGERFQYDPLTFSISAHVGPGAFGAGMCIL